MEELLNVSTARLLIVFNDPSETPSSIIPTCTLLKVSVPKFLIVIVGTMGTLHSNPLMGSKTAPMVASVFKRVDAGVTYNLPNVLLNHQNLYNRYLNQPCKCIRHPWCLVE